MLIIIDGNNALHRIMKIPEYFAMSYGGRDTGGVFGFFKTLSSTLAGLKYDKVIVVWDGKRSQRRKEIYPEYKENRTPKDNTEKLVKENYFRVFNSQKNIIENQLLPALGIMSVTLADHEADDVIYQICKLYQDKPITVVTEDKDMFQLINQFKSIQIYRPIAREFVNMQLFKEATGLPPSLFLIYKAICGDKSDGITGITGVAEVTALKAVTGIDENNITESLLAKVKAEYDDCIAKNKNISKLGKIYQGWGTVSRNLELVDLSREPFNDLDIQLLKQYIDNFKRKLHPNFITSLFEDLGFNSLLSNMTYNLMPFQLHSDEALA